MFASFPWMLYVAGRPERSILIVNMPLASPRSVPTFAAVPSVAKDVCSQGLTEIPHLGFGLIQFLWAFWDILCQLHWAPGCFS